MAPQSFWLTPSNVTVNQLMQLNFINQEGAPNKTEQILQVFQQRRDHVQQTCDRFRIKHAKSKNAKQSNLTRSLKEKSLFMATNLKFTQRLTLSSFLLDNSRNVMYCWIHKVKEIVVKVV